MKGLLTSWRATLGAMVFALTAVGTSSVLAGEAGRVTADGAMGQWEALEATETDDGLAMADDQDELEADTLPLAQRYVPPPPRGRYYRPVGPRWGYRIVPPPIFAPGWFGLYFLGHPPAPPPEAPRAREEVRRPDFRHVNEYSLGITGGAYYGTYQYGEYGDYSDPGLRVTLRYRNTPVVGSELAIGMFGSNMRFDGPGTNARSDVPVQLSAMVHMFPRSPIQPYLLLGATANMRTYEYVDSAGNFGDPYTELRVGPHLGLGVEFLIGDRIGATLDARRIIYTMVDRTIPAQTYQRDATVMGGLNFYF